MPEEANKRKHVSPGELQGQPKMPQIYITKYNRFVDAVLNRINRMLGKQYDPVRVKLLSQSQLKTLRAKNNPKSRINPDGDKSKVQEAKNKMGELEVARLANQKQETSRASSDSDEQGFVLISKVGSAKNENRAQPIRQINRKKVTTNKKTTNKTKPATNAQKNGNKTKQTANNNKNKPKAKATLYGLSTLKRDGDVMVHMMSDHTTVKTNFVLGPLTLRVEREVGRSGKRELRSATATTAEMFGRLNLKLMHGGPATLNSIRVLQPKQVRIDTTDNHDKTMEFMWNKSPQIASIVSSKLSAVARSMLQPRPKSRQ